MLIEVTQELKARLTASELQVVSWLNENEEKIPDDSINQIAEESFTSPATVSRAIRKAGFNGIM